MSIKDEFNEENAIQEIEIRNSNNSQNKKNEKNSPNLVNSPKSDSKIPENFNSNEKITENNCKNSSNSCEKKKKNCYIIKGHISGNKKSISKIIVLEGDNNKFYLSQELKKNYPNSDSKNNNNYYSKYKEKIDKYMKEKEESIKYDNVKFHYINLSNTKKQTTKKYPLRFRNNLTIEKVSGDGLFISNKYNSPSKEDINSNQYYRYQLRKNISAQDIRNNKDNIVYNGTNNLVHYDSNKMNKIKYAQKKLQRNISEPKDLDCNKYKYEKNLVDKISPIKTYFKYNSNCNNCEIKNIEKYDNSGNKEEKKNSLENISIDSKNYILNLKNRTYYMDNDNNDTKKDNNPINNIKDITDLKNECNELYQNNNKLNIINEIKNKINYFKKCKESQYKQYQYYKNQIDKYCKKLNSNNNDENKTLDSNELNFDTIESNNNKNKDNDRRYKIIITKSDKLQNMMKEVQNGQKYTKKAMYEFNDYKNRNVYNYRNCCNNQAPDIHLIVDKNGKNKFFDEEEYLKILNHNKNNCRRYTNCLYRNNSQLFGRIKFKKTKKICINLSDKLNNLKIKRNTCSQKSKLLYLEDKIKPPNEI
jgi:hypothetical protein